MKLTIKSNQVKCWFLSSDIPWNPNLHCTSSLWVHQTSLHFTLHYYQQLVVKHFGFVLTKSISSLDSCCPEENQGSKSHATSCSSPISSLVCLPVNNLIFLPNKLIFCSQVRAPLVTVITGWAYGTWRLAGITGVDLSKTTKGAATKHTCTIFDLTKGYSLRIRPCWCCWHCWRKWGTWNIVLFST